MTDDVVITDELLFNSLWNQEALTPEQKAAAEDYFTFHPHMKKVYTEPDPHTLSSYFWEPEQLGDHEKLSPGQVAMVKAYMEAHPAVKVAYEEAIQRFHARRERILQRMRDFENGVPSG